MVMGDGGKALIEFARKRTEPIQAQFKDPLGIAPDVHAVIGHDLNGGTQLHVIGFDRDGAWRDRPRRRKGAIVVSTLESFIALVNRQSGEQSVIFADDGESPKLTAVLNFHEPGTEGFPAYCDDRIVYPFPLSDEWTAWTEKDGDKLDQAEFAEWLENHLFDIGDPGSAGAISQSFAEGAGVKLAGRQALLALSKGLSVRVEHRVARSVNLQSGEGRIEYSEEHRDEDGGPLIVPAAFHIVIPVFRGGSRYSIPVRLRYRTSGGRVSWFFEIHRKELFMLDAVTDALAIVRKQEDEVDAAGSPTPGCGLPVYMGSAP